LLELEREFRAALLCAGAPVFTQLLQGRIDRIDAEYQAQVSQVRMGRRSAGVETLFGEVVIQRDYYHDAHRQEGHCPADAALGLEGLYTPALARLMCRAAAEQPYQEGSRDLAEYGGIEVNQRQIQRLVLRIGPDVPPWLKEHTGSPKAVPVMYISCDGTGTPMRQAELAGRKGKQPDGTAKTREVKLGAVFTQHTRDEEGRPIRDHQSTTYVGGFENAQDFALVLRQEGIRRGVGKAEQVVFLSDGAAWTEELQRQNFARAVSILDFYHAAERVHALAKAIDPEEGAAKKRASKWIRSLLKDKVSEVIEQARALLPSNPEKQKAATEQINFLDAHQARMRYGTYRKKGWFIGSGVIEAGCKTVVGKRLKQSGMFWSQPGASSVLQFRTILLSDRFDAFWTDRQNTAAARNDALALDA
jgi:hypothetical protein